MILIQGLEKTTRPHTRHGKRYHPIYMVWRDIKNRTGNKNSNDFKYYGQRGIKVCDRWLDINNFIEDMYPSYENGLTLDRIDVNGNYEPNNCRWTNRNIQARNTRALRSDNTSGYRGVSFHKRDNNWQAKIAVNSKDIHIGCFNTAIEAGYAYDKYVVCNMLEHTTNGLYRKERHEYV